MRIQIRLGYLVIAAITALVLLFCTRIHPAVVVVVSLAAPVAVQVLCAALLRRGSAGWR